MRYDGIITNFMYSEINVNCWREILHAEEDSPKRLLAKVALAVYER